MTHFILASSQACIGCRTCEVACALEHVAEGAEFHPRLKVMRLDTLSVPVMCHQCETRHASGSVRPAHWRWAPSGSRPMPGAALAARAASSPVHLARLLSKHRRRIRRLL